MIYRDLSGSRIFYVFEHKYLLVIHLRSKEIPFLRGKNVIYIYSIQQSVSPSDSSNAALTYLMPH